MNTLSGIALVFILLTAGPQVAASERGGCHEDFSNVPQLPHRGWIFRNNSQQPRLTGWFQGIVARFSAHSGTPTSYLSADKDNGGGSFPVLSNWAITPVVAFQPGVSLSFHTRSAGGVGSAADRLQVLYCQRGANVSCKNPGAESGSMNQFNELLWVNVNSDPGGYPTTWTAYSVGAAQGLPTSGSGRIAFRYYTMWQNPNDWGSTIGIDSATIQGTSGCAFTDTIFYNGLEGT